MAAFGKWLQNHFCTANTFLEKALINFSVRNGCEKAVFPEEVFTQNSAVDFMYPRKPKRGFLACKNTFSRSIDAGK